MRDLGIKKENKVKPTELQISTFENIRRGMKLRDAILAAGYDKTTALNPKQNVIESRGFQELIKEWRSDLQNAGITKEVLAEIQAEGLFDADAKVRLDYLKETKKDLGLVDKNDNTTNIQVNTFIKGEKDEFGI